MSITLEQLTAAPLLHWPAMRVGFIRSLLFARYGSLWLNLVRDVGLEPVFAEPETVFAQVGQARISAIPGLSFQLAAAEALALANCDIIFAPDLNPGPDVPRGGGQNPWIAAFPETLKTGLSGLPTVASVPIHVKMPAEVEGLATELLLSLTRDPARVRRAWERHAHRALPSKPQLGRGRIPGEVATVALVGQPWLLKPRLVKSLQQEGVHLLSQASFQPATLQAEGQRAEKRLISTDAEVLGAVRALARRGAVDRLIFLLDESSSADTWLFKQAQKVSHKALEARSLQELITPDTLEILLS